MTLNKRETVDCPSLYIFNFKKVLTKSLKKIQFILTKVNKEMFTANNIKNTVGHTHRHQHLGDHNSDSNKLI